MRLTQACGLRLEMAVGRFGESEDRKVRLTWVARRAGRFGGLSGRSVKGPGGLLLKGDGRNEGSSGGEHPNEGWNAAAG